MRDPFPFPGVLVWQDSVGFLATFPGRQLYVSEAVALLEGNGGHGVTV